MSGGERVRQEAGQESPRMPAWKRAILDQRKAKDGAAEAGATVFAARVNPDVVENGVCSKADDEKTSSRSVRTYTVSTASQRFPSYRGGADLQASRDPRGNKDAPDAPRGSAGRDDEQESRVLLDSLGPLQENVFIKREHAKRRRQDAEHAAAVEHILELYEGVPGIKTIRAENVVIIETEEDYVPQDPETRPGAAVQDHLSCISLSDFVDRRGGGVTEIRAKKVVIYQAAQSRSEENLSTLGRPDHDLSPLYEIGDGQGRVMRMRQKFDSNYGKLQKKSHSTEDLLESGVKPDLVPKHRLHPQPESLVTGKVQSTSVFQSNKSSKTKPKPPTSEVDSPHQDTGHPQLVSLLRQRFEGSGGHSTTVSSRDKADWVQPKSTRERDWEGSEVPPKPKVPCSPETRRARADSPSASIPSDTAHSSPELHIRPASKPEPSLIHNGESQARAPADGRSWSRKSFVVVPSRSPSFIPIKPPTSPRAAEVPKPGVPTTQTSPPASASPVRPSKEAERTVRSLKPDPSPPPPITTTAPLPLTPTPSPTSLAPTPVASAAPTPSSPVSAPPAPCSAPEEPSLDQLPVTNIDDIEVEPAQPVPAPSPVVQRKTGNTFTVVPKDRGGPQVPPESPKPAQGIADGAPVDPATSSAPHHQLGSLLKKRYPAVEDIEVIGGYLSLKKSCLSKSGAERTKKKQNIRFQDSRLSSTYEYSPSSSCLDSGEEDEEEERKEEKATEDQPSMVGSIHIGGPSFNSHAANSSDLSRDIPEHFSSWHRKEADDLGDTDPLQTSADGTQDIPVSAFFSENITFSTKPPQTFRDSLQASLLDEGEHEHKENGKLEETVTEDQPSIVGRIHIHDPSFNTHPATSTDLLRDSPEDFSGWPREVYSAYHGDTEPLQTSDEDMLKPADGSSLSDFSSEPALYF